MRSHDAVLSLLLLTLSVTPVFAQGPPPPPPPLQPLPPPPVPPGNPVTAAKANLGKVLFWDEQVSSTRTVACGSCHRATTGGSDPRSVLGAARSTNPGNDGIFGTPDDVTGSPGVVLNDASGAYVRSPLVAAHEQVTGRHAPSFINAAYAPSLFWDGRAGGTFVDPVSGATVLNGGGALESQAAGPPVSSAEMGHLGRDWTDVAARVEASKPLALSRAIPDALKAYLAGRGYAELFEEAFGSVGVSAARIAMAIASYERTLVSNQSPFDQLIAGNNALTPQENQGFQLFGQVGCAGCHAGALMSDNQFHYIGESPAAEDSGRITVSHNPVDLGAMRTPSLRNVGLRSVFMHDGRFSTLAEVVAFYNRGSDFNAPNRDPRIRPLNLAPPQQAALVAFLQRSLTDPRVANQTAPFDRPALFTETGPLPRVLDGGASATAGAPQLVAFEPPLVGNPRFTVGVYGALGGANAVLVLDAAEPPASGGIPAAASFARLSTVLAGSASDDGLGSVTLAIPDDPLLEGRTLYGRWYVEDPAALGGIAASDAFQLTLFGLNGSGLVAVNDPVMPRTLRLYPGRPNPFPASTTLRFDLLQASRARLAIYDVSGRTVRRLFDRGAAPAGAYAVTWDGRDDAGQVVPGGIYFYRLDTERGSESARVIRLP
jgi:cytochrome c peroxidase